MLRTRRLLRWLITVRICLSIFWFPCALGSQLNGAPNPGEDPGSIVGRMEEAYGRISDYEAIFIKQARFDGKMSKEEIIRFCFKKPFRVHMEWIRDPHKGRQVVYVEGENDDKIRAHKGGLLSFIVVSLDPMSPQAMKGSHHPITDAGIGRLIELMGSQVRRAAETEELSLRFLGSWEFEGRPCHKLEAVFPKDEEAGYYCYRAVLWIDCESMLPVQVMVYDWDNNLYEKFVYSKLRLNVGIPDSQFKL